MIQLHSVVVVLPAVVLLASACQSNGPEPPRMQLPPQVVVSAGAKDVRPETKPDGETGVTYTVREEFPADALLRQIRAVLPAPEWRPLPNDWLNPGVPSSHERGWTTFSDATKTPRSEVHQWLAQWQDSHGNVVVYVLRYDSRATEGQADVSRPDNPNLSVTAVWVPAAVAERMMSTAGGRGR
jgi:hypothetical protein